MGKKGQLKICRAVKNVKKMKNNPGHDVTGKILYCLYIKAK